MAKTKEDKTVEKTLQVIDHLVKNGGRPHSNCPDCFLTQDVDGSNIVRYDFTKEGVLSLQVKTTPEEKKNGAPPWKELNQSPIADVVIGEKGIELNASKKKPE